MIQKLFSYKRELVVASILFLLTSLIILIWFKDGYIYGGGDVGLSTFNPGRILGIIKYPWWEAQAPGFLIPLSITSVPFEFGLSILQKLGFSNLLLQAGTFFMLFFLMGFGMYFFLLTLFKKNHYLSLIGALFYLFNPYMLIQVWHRFVHTSIFFVALLPYLVIFWRKWIKEGKVRYLLIFLLINLLGSYLFGTLAFIVTLWLFLFTFTILEATIPFSGKRDFFIQIFRFGVGFVCWLLTNSWWLIPVLLIGSVQYGQQYNQDSNLVSMISISKQAILPFTLQLVNPFNLYEQLDFGAIYSTFLFKLIPWLGVSIVLIGLIRSLKEKRFVFFGILTLILIFLAKGSSTPLGNLFIWGFRHFFFIGVIRNPSEKIGILLPFVYAILFVLGSLVIRDYLKKYLSKNYIEIFLILILLPNIIFSWPIFAGKVFGSIDSPASIKVPNGYTKVNNFIKNQLVDMNGQDQGRILHLPLSTSEALTYNWGAGYHGTDPNIVLFDSLPSISRGLNLSKFDDPLKGLAFIFMSPYSQNQDSILTALQLYNVNFIILHRDADWLTDGIVKPEEVEQILGNLSFLKKINESGNLTVYKLADEYFQSKIVLSTSPDYIRSGENNSVWLFLAGNRSLITESPNSRINQDMYQYLGKSIIFPDKSYRYYQASGSALLSGTFHNSVIDRLNQVMQQAQSYGNTNARDSIEKLLSGIQLLRDILVNGQNSSANKQILSQYQDIIGGLFGDQLNFSGLLLYLDSSTLRLVFQEQLIMLDQLKIKYGDNEKILINEISNKIIELLIKNDLYPKSFSIDDIKIGTDRQVFNFSIPISSQYKIFITKSFDPTIFDNKLAEIPFFVDGQKTVLKSSIKGNILSLGSQQFEEGRHEISYPVIYSKNLFVPAQDWKISQGRIDKSEVELETSANTQSFVEIPFSGIEGGGLYRLNMELVFKQGESFYFELSQDSDSLNRNKEPNMQIINYIRKQDVGAGWRVISSDISMRLTSKNAKIRIVLNPDISILGINATLSVRNLSIQKVLNNTIFIKSENSIDEKGVDEGISKLNHPNPILYSGEINITKPSFLIFKETYHPGWVLKLKNDNSSYQVKDHLIGDLYGNAWFIEKVGKYSFIIKFDPMKYNILGFWLSFIAYLLLLFLIVWRKIRRKTL